ncbi:hypothetical protein M422DRAFT_87097, partial [Sphaerobolus stellatus SS14]
KTTKAISVDLNMLTQVVEHILKTWRETGEVQPKVSGKGSKRQRIMTDEEIEFLLTLSEQSLDIYLDEFQEQLQLQHSVIVGISTIWNTLTELGLSQKKMSYSGIIQANHNATTCAEFKHNIADELPERLVFINESRVDLQTTYRLNGWA